MNGWKIILWQSAILAISPPLLAQQFVPPGPVTYPGPAVQQPMVVPGQPYVQPGPVMVSPGQPMLPTYGPPSATFAQPIGTPPGAMMPGALPPGALPPGSVGLPPAPNPEPIALGPNPISIPAVDEEIAWDQIVDVVSEYFTVAREQRARRSGEVWTEGVILTAPLDGATWLEPHRKDSVGTFNRWESTFQTIRRRATVRVMPEASGYLVEVIVEKELEDLPNPEKATAGAAIFRNDTLQSRRLEQVSRTRSSPLWIQLGRDPPLEQRMLAEIQARFGVVAGPPAAVVR